MGTETILASTESKLESPKPTSETEESRPLTEKSQLQLTESEDHSAEFKTLEIEKGSDTSTVESTEVLNEPKTKVSSLEIDLDSAENTKSKEKSNDPRFEFESD